MLRASPTPAEPVRRSMPHRFQEVADVAHVLGGEAALAALHRVLRHDRVVTVREAVVMDPREVRDVDEALGLTTGGGCVALRIAGNISGSITIKNNRFFNGADATYGAYGCNINNLEMVQVETSMVASAVYILDNYCDLNIREVPSSAPNGPVACFTTVLQA